MEEIFIKRHISKMPIIKKALFGSLKILLNIVILLVIVFKPTKKIFNREYTIGDKMYHILMNKQIPQEYSDNILNINGILSLKEVY